MVVITYKNSVGTTRIKRSTFRYEAQPIEYKARKNQEEKVKEIVDEKVQDFQQTDEH